jgi:hypothetical protein
MPLLNVLIGCLYFGHGIHIYIFALTDRYVSHQPFVEGRWIDDISEVSPPSVAGCNVTGGDPIVVMDFLLVMIFETSTITNIHTKKFPYLSVQSYRDSNYV